MNDFVFEHLWQLLLLPPLLAGSAFFSGSETAFFSIERRLLREWANSPKRSQRRAARLAADREGLLIAILLGNLVVNLLFYSLTAMLSWTLATGNSPTAATAVGAAGLLAVVLLGEVLPKSVAYRWPAGFAMAASLPMLAVARALWPVGKALGRVSTLLAGPLQRRPSRRHLSADELDDMLELSAREGHIGHDERLALERVLTSCRLKVRDVLTPRVDIVAFNLSRPVEEFYALAHASHHTRIPAYRGAFQNMAGILLVREALIERPAATRDLERLLRPIVYVPETKSVDSLLMEFRKGEYNAVMAVDEFGGIEGLVTAEDIVEEIVGPIVDEFDTGEIDDVQPTGPGEYEIDGEMPLKAFEDRFDIRLKKTPAATLGGFVVQLRGDLPRVGDEVTCGRFTFKVAAMRRRRVTRLHVREAKGAPGPADNAPGAPPSTGPNGGGAS